MKKLSFLLLLIACFAFVSVEAYGQLDLGKGKDLIKKKDKKKDEKKTDTKQAKKTDESAAQKKESENVKSGDTGSDCDKLCKTLENNINGIEAAFEKKIDYSGYFNQAQANFDELEKKCPNTDISVLELRFRAIIGKIDEAEQPVAVNKDAMWKEHETFMQKFREDAYALYNMSVNPDYAVSNADGFYKQAVTLNYDTRKVLADSIVYKVWKPNELERGTIWNNYVWVAKKFWELYKEKADKEIEPFINECLRNALTSKNSGTDIAAGKNWAYSASTMVKAMYAINPESQTAAKYKKDADNLYAELRSRVGAKYFTSKLHEENAMKVVFSRKPITLKAEDPASFTNTFAAGDPIYAMGYFETDLTTSCSDRMTYWVNVYVDIPEYYTGVADFYASYPVTATNGKQSYVFAEIVTPMEANHQPECLDLMKGFKNLKPGKHVVQIDITRYNGNPMATGKFTLDCAFDGMAKLDAMIKPYEEKLIESVRMPKAAISNPALEQNMKNVLKEIYPDETPLRVVITDKDWTYERNAITGIIEFRYIGTTVAIKRANGECLLYDISFKQDYNGATYGDLWKYGVGGNQQIKCDNVMK